MGCSVPKCSKAHHAKGWCGTHYAKYRRITDICSVGGCGSAAKANNLCNTHYMRVFRTGDPLLVLPPSGGKPREEGEVRIDDGYRIVKCSEHPLSDRWGWVREHRKVMWDEYGDGAHPCWGCGEVLTWEKRRRNEPKKGQIIINHLNENKVDNSLENLVFSCNMCNRTYSLMFHLMDKFGVARP